MKENKLKWYIVNKEYINYLRGFDNKVENINYSERLKPYIGILITINTVNYYVPISSGKEKHYTMKENIDFIKIMNEDRVLGVLNLNNMIPISNENIDKIKSNAIKLYDEKIKNPNSKISKRCCDFKLLENKCREYIKRSEKHGKITTKSIRKP